MSFHPITHIRHSEIKKEIEALLFDVPLEIWIDTFKPPPTTDRKRIFIMLEPREILNLNSEIIKKHNNFDLILTFDDQLLEKLPNTALSLFGTTWLKNYPVTPKEFSVSMVCGFKKLTAGHKLRHQIWKHQKDIDIPKKFFMSSHGKKSFYWFTPVKNIDNNPLLGDDKSILFKSEFHVCIENVAIKNFFTEKLIDCLLAKSVPLYWGCTNISDFFNPDGFIFVKDRDDLIQKANQVTPELYNLMKPAILENFEKAKTYINLYENIKKTIEINLKND